MNFKQAFVIFAIILGLANLSMATPTKCLPQAHDCSFRRKKN